MVVALDVAGVPADVRLSVLVAVDVDDGCVCASAVVLRVVAVVRLTGGS